MSLHLEDARTDVRHPDLKSAEDPGDAGFRGGGVPSRGKISASVLYGLHVTHPLDYDKHDEPTYASATATTSWAKIISSCPTSAGSRGEER